MRSRRSGSRDDIERDRIAAAPAEWRSACFQVRGVCRSCSRRHRVVACRTALGDLDPAWIGREPGSAIVVCRDHRDGHLALVRRSLDAGRTKCSSVRSADSHHPAGNLVASRLLTRRSRVHDGERDSCSCGSERDDDVDRRAASLDRERDVSSSAARSMRFRCGCSVDK